MPDWARYLPNTLATRLFLLITLIEFAVDVSLQSFVLAKGEFLHNLFNEAPDERSALPIYVAIFAAAHLFQTILAVDAIINKNTIQIIALCVFNLMFLVYSVMQIQEVKTAFQRIGNPDPSVPTIVSIVPIMIGITEIIYCFLSWKIFKEFGWVIFKNLGADRRIRKMFLQYQVFICVCKFDVFFFFSFSMQFVLLVLKQDDIERWLTVAAAPVTLVLLVAGYYAARREIKWLMIVFMAGCVAGAAYFGFKLFRIYQDKGGLYSLVRKSLTVFSAISLLLLAFTICQSVVVFRNFGKGLRSHMNIKERYSKTDEAGIDEFGLHYKLSSANSSRMSID